MKYPSEKKAYSPLENQWAPDFVTKLSFREPPNVIAFCDCES